MADDFQVRDFGTGDPATIKAKEIASKKYPGHIMYDEAGRALSSPGYKSVAASSSATILGTTGAAGDYLEGITIIPETTSPGLVKIFDGPTSPDQGITIFVSGTVADLKPFFVPIKAVSSSGAWSMTTGTNVHAVASGRFT
jgi:hypothetical protein